MIRNIFTCFLATLIMFSCKEKNVTRKPLSVTPIDTSKIDYNYERIQNWKALKFGMFIHWGVYSIPAGVWKDEKIEKLGEQIMRHAHIPVNEYEEIAKQFNPVDFDADAMVKLAKDAGMKYVILTAKHHDGFAMFKTEQTNYNVVDYTPYKKDILKQLAEACKKQDMKLGVYYSTPDWHFNGDNQEINPVDNKISVFGKVSKENEEFQVNQLKELLSNYGDIMEVFFDMGEPTPEQSKRFRETVVSLQPNCLINGRVMNNQGDFITMPDNHLPDVPLDTIAWETPGTFYHTWGYKSWVKGAPLKEQIKNQVKKLHTIASLGGNFLLNIGPKSDGTVVQYEQDVLAGVGEWMKSHSEAIHGTTSTPFKHLGWGYCTKKKGRLYMSVFNKPKNNKLVIPGLKSKVSKVYILGDKDKEDLNFNTNGSDIEVEYSESINEFLDVIVVEYEGELSIIDPVIKSEKGVVKLTEQQAIKHGKYGMVSYRSILKDNFRTWEFEVAESGKYKIELEYSSKWPSKDFVFEVAGQELQINLKSDAEKRKEQELFDGNETAEKENLSKSSLVTVGEVSLEKGIVNTLLLRSAKPFPFVATLKEFKKQDRSNISLGLKIKDFSLTKVD